MLPDQTIHPRLTAESVRLKEKLQFEKVQDVIIRFGENRKKLDISVLLESGARLETNVTLADLTLDNYNIQRIPEDVMDDMHEKLYQHILFSYNITKETLTNAGETITVDTLCIQLDFSWQKFLRHCLDNDSDKPFPVLVALVGTGMFLWAAALLLWAAFLATEPITSGLIAVPMFFTFTPFLFAALAAIMNAVIDLTDKSAAYAYELPKQSEARQTFLVKPIIHEAGKHSKDEDGTDILLGNAENSVRVTPNL